MVSELFMLTDFFDVDRKMMNMMPILPIYSSSFNRIGMGIDGVAPPPPKNLFVYYFTVENIQKNIQENINQTTKYILL